MATPIKLSQETTLKLRSGKQLNATCPAATGTLDQVVSGDQMKPTNTSSTNSPNQKNPKRRNIAKETIKLASWSVRTLLREEAECLLAGDLDTFGTDVACIQEARIQDSVRVNQNTQGKTKYKLYCSGNEAKGQHGVAIAVKHSLANHVIEWKALNKRLCYLRLSARPVPLTIISAYAPTEDSFYNNLTRLLATVTRKGFIRIGGDMNAKAGEHLMEELANFRVMNDLVLRKTTFQKRRIRLPTWYSNDHRTKNQIDFIMVPRKMRSSVQDATVRRNHLLDSDHSPVIVKLRIKLKRYTKKESRVRFKTLQN